MTNSASFNEIPGSGKVELCVNRKEFQIIAGITVQKPATFGSEKLTARERVVMQELQKGLLYKEIAESLGIAFSTVNQHVNHIYRKLGAGNKVEAINKWISSPDSNATIDLDPKRRPRS